MDWSVILFVLKWIFLGLVYLALGVILIGVTREMRLRLPVSAPTTSAAIAHLRVIRPGSDLRLQPGAVLPLQPDTRLGSHADNTLPLNDRFISAHHARLRWDGVAWWVEDLNSTNGTFVNHQRLQPGTVEPIAAGAMLEVGDIAFELLE